LQETRVGRGTYLHGSYDILQYGQGAALIIGAFCSIADKVKFYTGGDHRIDHITTYPFRSWYASEIPFEDDDDGNADDNSQRKIDLTTKGDIVVGSDVWIGFEALILSGVKIGNGAVVAARAVVTKDVPAYAIVAGNPARVKKHRFTEEIVARLERVKWWDWEDWDIAEALSFLTSDDFDSFFAFAERFRDKQIDGRTFLYLKGEGEEELTWRAKYFCATSEEDEQATLNAAMSCDFGVIVCDILEACTTTTERKTPEARQVESII